jgi:hypothetical protein
MMTRIDRATATRSLEISHPFHHTISPKEQSAELIDPADLRIGRADMASLQPDATARHIRWRRSSSVRVSACLAVGWFSAAAAWVIICSDESGSSTAWAMEIAPTRR